MRVNQIISEDADSDVAAYSVANGIMSALINHLCNADPKSFYGFKAMRFSDGEVMLTLRGSDIGLTDDDAALWFRFGKMRGYTPNGHIAKFKTSRETAITIFCLDDLNDVAAAAKAIIYRRPVHDVLIHELTHYLDIKRSSKVQDEERDEQNGSNNYFNSPEEFNAYFTNVAGPWLHFLDVAKDLDQTDIEAMAKGLGIDRDFNVSLKKLIQKLSEKPNPAMKKFWGVLRQDRHRSILKRLYALHQKIITVLSLP